MSHAAPREFFYTVETTANETQADWPSNGQPVYVIEPSVEGFTIDVRDSDNIAPRRQFIHEEIHGLRSGATMSWGHYLTAKGSNAAETAQATADDVATIMQAGLGGMSLGWSIGLDGAGSATTPGTDADPGFAAGDWGFFYDDSGAVGEFRRIESSTATTVTLFEDLTFTPDDAADVLHAVIAIYPDEPALSSHADANYNTLGVLIQGEDVDDVYAGRGVKPTITIESITAGEEVKIKCEAKVTTYPDAMPAKQTVAGTPSGIAPLVASIGTTSSVRLGDFGGALAGVDCRGSIQIDLGIDHDPIMGVCGTEGVKGYIGTGLGTAKVTLTVAIDDAFDVDFFAKTKKHLMIQIGDQPTDAIAFYFPRLKWASKPKRVDDQGTTSMTMEFVCMEDTADSSGNTGDDIAQRRAPFIILRAA